jgi:metal iron transporter
MTRLLAIIPSMVVAIAVGRSGVDTLLVASQVVLSVVLPFIVFPLLWCTSSRAIMSVKKGVNCVPDKGSTSRGQELTSLPKNEVDGVESGGNPQEGVISYSSNKITTVIGGVIWFVIVAANVYALVELGTGSGRV